MVFSRSGICGSFDNVLFECCCLCNVLVCCIVRLVLFAGSVFYMQLVVIVLLSLCVLSFLVVLCF